MEIIKEIIQVALQPVDILATAIAGEGSMSKGIVSLAIIGFVLALMRKTPKFLLMKLKRRCVVSVEISGTEIATNMIVRDINNFICSKTKITNFYISRTGARTKEKSSHCLVPLNSKGVFFHKRRIYFYSQTTEVEKANEKSGTKFETIDTVRLSTIGTNPNFYEDLLSEKVINGFLRPNKNLYYYLVSKSRDILVTAEKIEEGPKLFIDSKIKSQLDKAIKVFEESEDWFKSKRLSRKLNIVIYGPPGTGKTAIAHYIAKVLNRSIAKIDVMDLTDSNFESLYRESGKKGAIFSVQDFENNLGFLVRSDSATELRANAGEKPSLSLSTILNTFQGEIPCDGEVSIFTTNKIELIDPAFLRKGRTDLLLEVGPLTFEQIQEFFLHYYEDQEKLPDEFKEYKIRAADLMGALTENIQDPKGFLEAIKTLNYEPIKEKEINTNEIRGNE